jgi:hypothetical protein
MVLYSYLGGDLYYSVRSCTSYNGGLNWFPEGSVFDSTITTETYGVSDITARKGEGFGAVSPSRDGCFYRHRGYPSGSWSPAALFSDQDANPWIKASIERIAENSYGIIYVDDSTGVAYFDISQWPESGVEETITDGKNVLLLDVKPSISSGLTSIEYILSSSQNISLDVYDLLGNHVINLVSGEVPAGTHSASWDGKNASGNLVASGMYFCVLKATDGKNAEKLTLLR